MDREERVAIRLECLKLACAKSGSFGDTFKVADEFENYVLAAGAEIKTPSADSQKSANKNSGKSAILS